MPSGATVWGGGRYVEWITWDLAPTANPKFPAPIGYWPLHLPLLEVKQAKRFLRDQPQAWWWGWKNQAYLSLSRVIEVHPYAEKRSDLLSIYRQDLWKNEGQLRLCRQVGIQLSYRN